MSKYFMYLNWCQLIMVIVIATCLKGVFMTPGLIGAVLGGVGTAGASAWQYHRDHSLEKEKKWLFGYFGKIYRYEIGFMACLTAFTLALRCIFPHSGVFMFLLGILTLFLTNYIFEVVWKHTAYPHIVKKWISQNS